MQTRSWDGQDGVKRYRTELIAEEVRFLGQRGDAAGGGGFAPGMAVGADSEGDIDPDELPF
jgi:single-strand DNA-binding protein